MNFKSADGSHVTVIIRIYNRTMKGGKNENLFMSCVGELVLESREFDLLLGTLKQDGSRSPGLIDRYIQSVYYTTIRVAL